MEKGVFICESDTFKVAIVRAPMIYGADSPGNFQRLMQLSKMVPVLPQIENQRSALYIKHLTTFITDLITLESAGVFHPQDDFYFETTAVMREIRRQYELKTLEIWIPKRLNRYLNQIKLFKKLFGHLTYANDLYHDHQIQERVSGEMAEVMKEIVEVTKKNQSKVIKG
ncbi:hypothetical protein [Staphylococcus intermedius]|uniref:hypothetical protein n=1 Tax=Staphylococcus intermedius TaxID=1285 RepID=UPI0002FEA9D1|nr:hypothetical protein [Staphylococcus intermedius]PCF64213.1 capsular polysaccharide biosynthesis protein Cap5N [Staphylococcus intermedius]PCF78928.1 capsular polysaccharide biosynthesis protein Cap5N [Staphylococcus intermedius]PCF79900.1 capsular polysaccharide biosynthesis protein Cap5N [Staphylococcus intermedius]PCF89440.1 capsular polysaccharide biosynthesis protein Cap5N [Staphylococcus intermedius]PNZ50916.1 capsular polysaccharide biosynthesis protein Cap5N [Staphylococcus intermed